MEDFSAIQAVHPPRDWRWAVRRALLGAVILMATVAGGAMLLYASIEADSSGAAVAQQDDSAS